MLRDMEHSCHTERKTIAEVSETMIARLIQKPKSGMPKNGK